MAFFLLIFNIKIRKHNDHLGRKVVIDYKYELLYAFLNNIFIVS